MVLGWVPSQSDMILWSGASFRWPLDLEQLRADLARAESTNRSLWTAEQDEDMPVGCASVIVSEDGATGRYGRVLLNPSKRGNGYGRLLVCSSVRAAFQETGIDLATLGVFEHNQATRLLYEELGFVASGVVFDTVVDGRAWRRIEMTCLRSSFREDVALAALEGQGSN